MTVNGEQIFSIVTHKDVLVEKTIKRLNAPDYVPIYLNLNNKDVIGIAKLYRALGKPSHHIYADIHLFAPLKGFPAIGYVQENKIIYALGICNKPNLDKEITAIGL